ncbi:MerR family transcriptional regulator [Bdellovibrionota bacterium FG-2]
MTTMMMEMTNKVQIPDRLFFRIGDVAELLGIKPYVLRYWESEFPIIAPEKSTSGQRVYRRTDVETVLMIKHLLYEERYSIEGAKKRIRELRKEGALKSFKQETVSQHQDLAVDGNSSPIVSMICDPEILTLARDVQHLVQQPISELFPL